MPPIHDISTDLENPPAFAAIVPLRAEAANALNRTPDVVQQRRHGPGTLTLPEPSGQVFARARTTAERLGWEIVKADPAAGLIEATDTTRWFGFVDDVVIRVTPWGRGREWTCAASRASAAATSARMPSASATSWRRCRSRDLARNRG